ncbi:Fe-S cluster assembly protein SufD [Candidatus Pelagibacter sp.]|nr:Fe-S cluster assembly protein SufD [Candidatus Pelagibacter sp.]
MEEQLKIDFEKKLEDFSYSDQEKKFKETNFKEFLKQGFPNRKLENWKFSDLNQIIKSNIGELTFYNDYKKENQIDKIELISELEHNKIIIVDGKIEKIDFKFEDKDKIDVLVEQSEETIKENINSLINLNNAFSNKFCKIIIKKNYSLKKPLVIYHSTNKNTQSKNTNSRIDFKLEENACLRLIDIFKDNSEKNFLNIYYNFELVKSSILKNYKIDKVINNNVKYSYNNLKQEANSISETFILSSGSTFFKNEINCDLQGQHSSAFVNGIFDLDDENHHEIKSNINHLVENTKSYQLVKSVLEKKSKAVYQGKIFVSSEAQKTDGYQLSNAILLSENSEFNAKPELEIYADDVKCSHGSSSGSLDENSIFYLMSRGLNYKEAKKLLINGFLLDVIEKITDEEIKNLIKNLLGVKE